MRLTARKVVPGVFLGGLFVLASVAPGRTSAAESGLLECDNFECPGECPMGADPCCAILPLICVPGPCET